MIECYRKIGQVNIAFPLYAVADAHFIDTGGTNGWLALEEPWLAPFVRSIAPLLAGIVQLATIRLLPAGQGIPPHIDQRLHEPTLVHEHRYHVPLVTHSDVTMRWPNEHVEVHMESGWLYEVSVYDRVHEVVQRAPIGRIHVCIDTVEVLHKEISPCCY